MDEWYCQHCKSHQKGKKKLDIWKLPDVLVIHMKRFVQHPRTLRWTKREVLVDYPLNEVDFSSYALGEKEEDCHYELFAVSNHWGILSGGHYTAYCKLNNKWHEFDDDEDNEIDISTAPVSSVNEAGEGGGCDKS